MILKKSFFLIPLILWIILFHHGNLDGKGKINLMGRDIYVGMPYTTFKQYFPSVKLTPNYHEWSFQARVFGLDGKWYFRFKENRLDWYQFSYYITDYKQLNQKNFDRCLEATEDMLDYLTEIYGKPVYVSGQKVFRDPFKKLHYGYTVLKAHWKTKMNKIQLRFHFFGGKGRYFFVISLDFHSKNYHY